MLRLRSVFLASIAFVTTWMLTAAENQIPGQSSSPAPDNAAVKGSFWQGFLASLSVVIVSELADKTFFIAAIMAMKHSRIIVFSGAISALVFMTVLSAAFGWVATVIPRVYTHYISAALFAIFGLKMLRDGWKMDPSEGQEELDEVQTELKRREEQDSPNPSKSEDASERPQSPESVISRQGSTTTLNPRTPENRKASLGSKTPEGPKSPDADGVKTPTSPKSPETSEAGVPSTSRSPDVEGQRIPEVIQAGPSTRPEPLRDDKEESVEMLEQGQAETRRRKRNAVVKVLLQAATLTFLAEWGDRSQLATVVLATREDVFGVVVGGSLGHALCTGLAVIGGRMVAQKISVRTVTIIGGLVFLFFAVSALVMGPGE